jgi:uncharacterized membrane protein
MAAQRGFDRLVNLSDAVVAIAATLLVLPLVDTASEIDQTSALALLADHSDELLAFALSFVVICRFWLVHHSMFTKLVGFTPSMLWINFLWMGSIAFLPFPTELVSFAGNDNPGVSALYIGTMLVTSAASTLQLWVASRTPSIQAEDVRGTLSLLPSVVATLTMAVALVIAVVLPAVGLWSILLLLVTGPIEARYSRRKRATAGAS